MFAVWFAESDLNRGASVPKDAHLVVRVSPGILNRAGHHGELVRHLVGVGGTDALGVLAPDHVVPRWCERNVTSSSETRAAQEVRQRRWSRKRSGRSPAHHRALQLTARFRTASAAMTKPHVRTTTPINLERASDVRFERSASDMDSRRSPDRTSHTVPSGQSAVYPPPAVDNSAMMKRGATPIENHHFDSE